MQQTGNLLFAQRDRREGLAPGTAEGLVADRETDSPIDSRHVIDVLLDTGGGADETCPDRLKPGRAVPLCEERAPFGQVPTRTAKERLSRCRVRVIDQVARKQHDRPPPLEPENLYPRPNGLDTRRKMRKHVRGLVDACDPMPEFQQPAAQAPGPAAQFEDIGRRRKERRNVFQFAQVGKLAIEVDGATVGRPTSRARAGERLWHAKRVVYRAGAARGTDAAADCEIVTTTFPVARPDSEYARASFT